MSQFWEGRGRNINLLEKLYVVVATAAATAAAIAAATASAAVVSKADYMSDFVRN